MKSRRCRRVSVRVSAQPGFPPLQPSTGPCMSQYDSGTWAEYLPEFVLHQGSGRPAPVGLQPSELLVAAVVLLNEHGRPPALLELLLLMVAAKFTLDKDGGLRHLLIKCVLLTRNETKSQRDASV